MFFDTHAHYDDEQFDHDRDETIARVHEEGVGWIVNAASNEASAEKAVALSQRFDFIYAAVGVHPHEVASMDMQSIDRLADLASARHSAAGSVSRGKVVAIGEIGLDYKYCDSDDPNRDLQKQWFIRQMELAAGLRLPVIIHDRDAHEDVLNILKLMAARHAGGVLHHFSGSAEMAFEVLRYGFYISVAGPVTYKNARRIVEVLKIVPDDRLLIETDCPYLAPEPFRGKRNDSGLIRYTAGRIAEIKSVPIEKVAEITTRNAMELFGVKI